MVEGAQLSPQGVAVNGGDGPMGDIRGEPRRRQPPGELRQAVAEQLRQTGVKARQRCRSECRPMAPHSLAECTHAMTDEAYG